MPAEKEPRAQALEQHYSNHLEVGFNALEFLLRFAQARGDEPPRPLLEVVTNPAFARAFSATLAEAVTSYEERFGPIPDANDFVGGSDM